MKWILLVLLLLVILFLYYGVSMYFRLGVSRQLIAEAKPFKLLTNDENKTLLVLGDSTAVGVGATRPEDTLAALVAKHIEATHAENYGSSGARVADLEKQAASATSKRYSLVLVQIGANDIVRFKNADDAARVLGETLTRLPEADKVVVISAGNVGGTKFFPWFINPFYTRLTLAYHEAFAEAVTKSGGTYVNLYQNSARDPFVQEPEKYLASDSFHPSSAGYNLWFEKIVEKARL